MNELRFVVLEDDAAASEDYEFIIKDLGYKISLHRGSASFFEYIDTFDDLDVFILDLMLKKDQIPENIDIEGIQTGQIILKEVRRKLPKANIFVITAYNLPPEDPFNTVDFADKVYYKPLDIYDVINEIVSGLKKR